jgi:hypothetical protein
LAAGILEILVGVAGIAFASLPGSFYPAFIRQPRPDEKPMPKWLGRTIFVVVGVIFILSGLWELRHH